MLARSSGFVKPNTVVSKIKLPTLPLDCCIRFIITAFPVLRSSASFDIMMNGDRSNSHRNVARLVFRHAARDAYIAPATSGHWTSSQGYVLCLIDSACSPSGGPDTTGALCRQQEARTIFVGPAAPQAVKDAMVSQKWAKTSFDVRALIGKTQVVWVYDAVCKHSRIQCALKCYRKESQSQINYQYDTH